MSEDTLWFSLLGVGAYHLEQTNTHGVQFQSTHYVRDQHLVHVVLLKREWVSRKLLPAPRSQGAKWSVTTQGLYCQVMKL